MERGVECGARGVVVEGDALAGGAADVEERVERGAEAVGLDGGCQWLAGLERDGEEIDVAVLVEPAVDDEREGSRVERLWFRQGVVGFGLGDRGVRREGEDVWRRCAVGVVEADEDVPCCVVESDPEAAEAARTTGALVVEGDATRNEVLEAAGIERARALIACVREDSGCRSSYEVYELRQDRK